jgi:hypothetical protein
MQQDAAEFTAAVVTGKEFIRMGKKKNLPRWIPFCNVHGVRHRIGGSKRVS